MPETEKIVIVPQTKIAFMGYVLIIVAQIIAMYFAPSQMYPFSTMFLIAFILAAILGLYVINCTVLGKCNLYAWIMGYVLFVLGIVTVISIIMKLK